MRSKRRLDLRWFLKVEPDRLLIEQPYTVKERKITLSFLDRMAKRMELLFIKMKTVGKQFGVKEDEK